jgi:hypothetical protein
MLQIVQMMSGCKTNLSHSEHLVKCASKKVVLYYQGKMHNWKQIMFILFWILFPLLYAFFWVIPQHLKFICWRFGTLCLSVAYRGGFGGFKPPPPRNSEILTKYQKLRKFYYMKWNYSCLENPWLGGHCPQIPVLSVLNWICWTPPE